MSQKKKKQEKKEADALGDEKSQQDLAEALDQLTPEEADMFVRALELTLKKRRIMFWGYIGAIVALLVGAAVAFAIYGSREPGEFVGYAFLIPPLAAGAILYLIGKYARAIKK